MTEQTETDNQLKAHVAHSNYDNTCKLLSVVVLFKNHSDEPIYVVAEDFAFVRMGFVGPHYLAVENKAKSILIDLSFLRPTQTGLNFFQRESSTIVAPDTIVVDSKGSWSATYVFQFPISLDTRFSAIQSIDQPKAEKNVVLRFGYSTESLTKFIARNQPAKKSTAKEQNELILNKWQKTLVTNPISIKFQ